MGVYEMDVIDTGGTDFGGNPISENTVFEMQLYYFSTSGQSFTINGVQYVDVTSVDNGYIEIDGVEIGGSILGFPDPTTGNEEEFFFQIRMMPPTPIPFRQVIQSHGRCFFPVWGQMAMPWITPTCTRDTPRP